MNKNWMREWLVMGYSNVKIIDPVDDLIRIIVNFNNFLEFNIILMIIC